MYVQILSMCTPSAVSCISTDPRPWWYSNPMQTDPLANPLFLLVVRDTLTFHASILNSDEFAVFSTFVKTPIAKERGRRERIGRM